MADVEAVAQDELKELFDPVSDLRNMSLSGVKRVRKWLITMAEFQQARASEATTRVNAPDYERICRRDGERLRHVTDLYQMVDSLVTELEALKEDSNGR